jgi:hypothetical protein
LQDRPGELSFVDRETFVEGEASLRFDNLAHRAGGQRA